MPPNPETEIDNKVEDTKLPDSDTPMDAKTGIDAAEAKANKETGVDLTPEDADKGIDKAQIEKAAAIAKELEGHADKFDKALSPEDQSYLVEKLTGFCDAIYRSGIFQVIEKIWNKSPKLLQEIGLGKGVTGFLLKSTTVTGMLVEFNQGMVQAGMLAPPEGIKAEDFTKDSLTMLKMLKFVLPIVSIVQPEFALLAPFIPLVEKLTTKQEEVLSQVRSQIEISREELSAASAETREDIAQATDDVEPPIFPSDTAGGPILPHAGTSIEQPDGTRVYAKETPDQPQAEA